MYRFSRFSSFAGRIARSIAHPSAFLLVLILVIVWLLAGPIVGFNSLWQNVFSSAATIVTFLLLFLIQHTQARETAAMQLKLNELIRASEGSHNALLDIEQLTHRDYDQIRENYSLLAKQAREQIKDGNLKWATARIQMESLESLLDPDHRNSAPETQDPERNKPAIPSRLLDAPIDLPVNTALDRLAAAVASALNVPMTLISLVGAEAQSFPGQIGLPEPYRSQRRAPLSHSFCEHVVAGNKPIIIRDARTHPLIEQSPAIQELNVIAYAGVPLLSAENRVSGVLCAVDHRPRVWTAEEISLLQAFAGIALQEILVTLPVEQANSPSASVEMFPPESDVPARPEKSAPSLSTPRTVLVADDSATNRKLLARYLENEGYKAVVFDNGEEALAYLDTGDADLILLDIMMSGLDGEQMLQALQTDDRHKGIPVVMISALDEQESVDRCLRQGARDYVLKPFTLPTLQACLRKHLGIG